MPKRIYTRAYATARFWADDLDPMVITQALLLPPDTQHRRGEPRLIRTKSGKVEQRTSCGAGAWTMSSEHWVDSPRLHIHLLWLLEQLGPHETAISKILAGGVMADFFCYSCGSTSTPPPIPQAVRDRSHALGFKIEIDHYDTSGDPSGG
ncbi:DUF4279 domain-containing protein [Rhodopirellula sp. P2]|uniref:DUF4279 domain-containing protein n=1 Tax=Rhodopirellula sp. P2 TaxID=2127060 RepID=UPI003FD51705